MSWCHWYNYNIILAHSRLSQSPKECKLTSSEHSFTSSGPSCEKKSYHEDKLASKNLLAAKKTGCEGTAKQEREEIQEVVDGISSDDSKFEHELNIVSNIIQSSNQ